ncbi:hypothetical protein QR680_019164 [Steinernema hermaphroditum]|uniref:Uncharacterized protein n=1 Tax=Steinernema hermaphroditum TaxID=289476 RepID=A0AA39HK63_9BILA|nr:hypothetical protein QR680_019164 [Steinernema hermaphroditum]
MEPIPPVPEEVPDDFLDGWVLGMPVVPVVPAAPWMPVVAAEPVARGRSPGKGGKGLGKGGAKRHRKVTTSRESRSQPSAVWPDVAVSSASPASFTKKPAAF